MKQLLFLLLFTQVLFSLHFANTLPKESNQLIGSFECFSKEDKMLLEAYLLALKYRMEHVDEREKLVETELDYWRLWHIISDIEEECKLNYRFDRIMEETLIQNSDDRRILKKLRRVESSIHAEGASESSAKMSKYDDVLRKIILLSPPQYTVLPKNAEMHDYNLTTLKQYPSKSIPKNIYDQIEKMKATQTQKDLLLREAYLREEMIRNYDKPQKRKKMKQEMLYLEACQRLDGLYANGEFYHNFKRKLANRSVATQYYGLKQEFLPKEIESYCEYNITKMKLGTFIPKADKVKKKKPGKLNVKLENLTSFLKKYDSDTKKKKYAQEYLSLMKQELEKPSTSTPSLESLRLLRLKDCLVHGNDKDDFALILSRVKDFRIEGIKETFYSNIFNSQIWWKMTIKMKMEAEGETAEMKHFFDCNQTLMTPGALPVSSGKKRVMKETSRFTGTDVHKAISQKDEILKFYAKLFENRPSPELSNDKAIKVGIVSKKWIDESGKISAPFGDSIVISGMPKGGIKLTYTGIPKGKLCTEFIQLNKNDVIFFNKKTYDGIDYIMVNDKKIKLDHFVYRQLQRVCSMEENNTVSFIREGPIVEHKYGRKLLDSAFDRVRSIKTIDTLRYDPDGAAFLQGMKNFMISGNVAKLYDAKIETVVQKLPRQLENSFRTVFSPDGKYLAVGRYGSKIYIWDMQQSRVVKTIKKKKIGSPKLFLPDNKTLLVSGQKIHFLDVESEKIIATIKPKYMPDSQKYNTTRISALTVSPGGNMLYVGGNKRQIERWKIERPLSGSGMTVSYVDKIEDSSIREIGALLFDKNRKDVLVIVSKDRRVKFYDTKTKKTLQTYIADEYMGAESIVISDDNKYMLVMGDHGAFLWKLGEKEQYDIVKGSKVAGGIFLEDSSKFILMAREVKVWKIEERL